MIKKKVFLLADIGKNKKGFYHVGDEAMFLSNLENYRKNGIEVFASSRSICHPELKGHEVLDIYILNLLQFTGLLLSAILFRLTNINFFPLFFRKTIECLISCDTLHISGGGNITDLWPGHIYYRSLMIIIAKLYGKRIILTSQSLGPINKIRHKIILHFVLNNVDYIGLRDNSFSRKTADMLKIDKNRIHFNYDDALFWLTKQKILSRSKKIVNVGISLHDPKNNDITKEIINFLREITKRHKEIKIHFIPHMLDSDDNYDVEYAKKIVSYLNGKNIRIFDSKHLNAKKTLAEQIRQITGKMDFVIASRYHGLVFAISSQIPFLAINFDNDYYKGKNTGLIKVFTKKYSDFAIDFKHIKSDYILSKFNEIYKNRVKIQHQLNNFIKKADEENNETKNSIYRLEWDSF